MMRTLAIILLLFLTSDVNSSSRVSRDDYRIISEMEKQAKWEQLVQSIILVESEGKKDAVGDNGKAVGLFQIHPIMVRDVNRIIGENVYTYHDRLDSVKSREMFEIYQSYYNPDKDLQTAAYLWNGGPRYYNYMGNVKKYWKKINNVKI